MSNGITFSPLQNSVALEGVLTCYRGTKQGMLEMDCRSLGGNKLSGPLPGLDIFHSLRKL
jgi:hypothetical protein